MAIELVVPLDYLILGALPEQGALVLGVYPDARSSNQLSEDPLKGALDATLVGRRLLSLHTLGFVVKTNAPKTRNGTAWQRTPLGKQTYDKWIGDQMTPEEAA